LVHRGLSPAPRGERGEIQRVCPTPPIRFRNPGGKLEGRMGPGTA
jgi:hypothetical protein